MQNPNDLMTILYRRQINTLLQDKKKFSEALRRASGLQKSSYEKKLVQISTDLEEVKAKLDSLQRI